MTEDSPSRLATPGPAAWLRSRGPDAQDSLILVLAYTLAWGLMLVNRGIYWDDWTVVGLSPASMAQGFREIGAVPWVQYLSVAIYTGPLPGLVGHTLVFVAYLLSTLAFHRILRRTPGLVRMDATVAALTFAVLPVNYARVALVDFAYALSLLAFLAATLLLVQYLEGGSIARRLAAAVLYLVSFATPSLLVLSALPMALSAYIVWRTRPERRLSFALRHAEFVALPFAYWTLKTEFLASTGVYDTYNSITLEGLKRVPSMLLAVPREVLLEPLARAVVVSGLLGAVAGIGVGVWLLRRHRAEQARGEVPGQILALVGFGTVVLGVLPYLAVGKAPILWDWSSRHQLLVPLGVGLIAAAGIRGMRAAGRAGPVLGLTVVLLAGMSIVADARTLMAYQLDWFKQVALVDAVRAIPSLETARHVVVVDDARGLDAMRRSYRFYEYNAMFSLALGNERRLVSDGTNEPAPADLPMFISRPGYHMREYVPSPPDLEIRLTSPNGEPGVITVLKLVVLEAVGSPSFNAEAARLLHVVASPIPATTSP